ncbi:MAG: hypothetical protein ACJARN_002008 [Arenicella sp.]|jgi:hypothetical protein
MPRFLMTRNLSIALLIAMNVQGYATNALSIELNESQQGD